MACDTGFCLDKAACSQDSLTMSENVKKADKAEAQGIPVVLVTGSSRGLGR